MTKIPEIIFFSLNNIEMIIDGLFDARVCV